MTERVDFYVLESSTSQQRALVACRLAEKAYLRNLSVALFSDSASEAERLDELLWTFSERSFIPHELYRGTAPTGALAPVRLGVDLETIAAADVLVNLSRRFPAPLERFGRVAEIIDGDEECRRLGRERFKSYRELKLPLETHRLDDAATP